MSQLNKRKCLRELIFCGALFASLLGAADVLSNETDSPQDMELQETRKGFLDPEQKKQLALAETLEEHEKVWLDVLYPETESPRNVLAIAKTSLKAETHGAILLLHDKEQHADWPQIIRPVRMSLPKYGWFTLSVNLPDELRMQQPERELAAKEIDQISLNEALKKSLDSPTRVRSEPESKDSTAVSDGNVDAKTEDKQVENQGPDDSVDINLAAGSKEQKPKIPYQIRALSHIEKAMAYLRNQNYENIVMLVSRQSSPLVFEYIKQHQGEITSSGFALVLVQPDLPESYIQDVSAWLGADFKPPVLDIVDSDNKRARTEAELRKLAFERAGAKNYRQIFMPVSNSMQFHESLTKRVRLWLENVTPGLGKR